MGVNTGTDNIAKARDTYKTRQRAISTAVMTKYKTFANAYLQTSNATQAAIKAGYAPKSANVTGNRLLKVPYIKAYIAKVLKDREDRQIAKTDEILQYLTACMRGEIKDQLGLDASLQDRTRAAELLGKRYAIFTDKLNVEGNIDIASTLAKARNRAKKSGEV